MHETSLEEQIFSEALALSVDERPAFLDRACKGDARLRQGIEALLNAHAREEVALDVSPIARPAPRSEEQPGDWIGRYKLLQKIGEGGCGVVYMAEQEEPVRRRVALKVIKLGMDTKSVIARFEAERQALALMDHPNIARVLEAGATASGRPFFVMELVRGLPITRFCDENKLSTTDRVRLFTQVCNAIQHAHQKGVIHRDIKPSNILVTLHDDAVVPKVIDFGIAKATQGRLTDQTLFTAFEQFVGTPAYMSPEQANLSGIDVDTRSDVYSLGVLLYELLTGRTPFDAKELASAGLDEMRRQIREVDPPLPSGRLSTLGGMALTSAAQQRRTAPPKLIRLIRGDLDWIVMRCLEKDRRRRYDTANDLALDLQRYLAHQPITARPPTLVYRFIKLVRRHRVAFATVSVIGAALVISLGSTAWSLWVERAARRRAVAAEQKAIMEAKKSEQVSEFLQTMLESIGPSVALGRDTVLLRELLEQTAERMERDLRGQPAVEAQLRETIGRVYFELGEFEKAKSMHEAALTLRRVLFGPEHVEVARSLRNLGRVVGAQGDAANAEQRLREALAMQRKLSGEENLEIAATLSDLAAVLMAKRDVLGAEAEQRTALTLQRSDPFASARLLSDLALSVRARGDLEAAEKLAREALDVQRKLRGSDHLEVAEASYALGAVLYSRGRTEEAESAIRYALELERKLLGSRHPLVAQSLHALGAVLLLKQDYKGGEAALHEALALRRSILGYAHPLTGDTLGLIAEIRLNLFDRDGAMRLARETLDIHRKAFGDDHGAVAESLVRLSRIAALGGDGRAAEKMGREALAIWRRQGDPGVVRGLGAVADLLHWQGNYAEAIALNKERLHVVASLAGPDDRLSLGIRHELAKFYDNAGAYDVAVRLAEPVVHKLTQIAGPLDATTLSASEYLAVAYRGLKRYEESIALLDRIARISEEKWGHDHPSTQRIRHRLGYVYMDMRKFEEAQAIFEHDLAISRALENAGHHGRLAGFLGMGEVLLFQGRWKESEAVLSEYCALGLKHIGPTDVALYFAKSILGEAVARQGRFAEAEAILLSSFDEISQRKAIIPRMVWSYYRRSAERLHELYLAWGKADEAAKWKARAEAAEKEWPEVVLPEPPP